MYTFFCSLMTKLIRFCWSISPFNLFLANTPILYPLKHHKTIAFLVFLEGIKVEVWTELIYILPMFPSCRNQSAALLCKHIVQVWALHSFTGNPSTWWIPLFIPSLLKIFFDNITPMKYVVNIKINSEEKVIPSYLEDKKTTYTLFL